jgi:hypothetical protein
MIEPQTNNQNFGQIKYDPYGKPTCHICGKSFHRLLQHVRQVHTINAKDYKAMFGLIPNKGIMSEVSLQKSQANVSENFDKAVANLLKHGVDTRFKKGHEGRTRDKMSEQSRLNIVSRNQNR